MKSDNLLYLNSWIPEGKAEQTNKKNRNYCVTILYFPLNGQ